MYEAVKALILQLLSSIYSNDTIFQGYQNDYTLPEIEDFVIMSIGETLQMMLIPEYGWNATDSTSTYKNVNSTFDIPEK